MPCPGLPPSGALHSDQQLPLPGAAWAVQPQPPAPPLRGLLPPARPAAPPGHLQPPPGFLLSSASGALDPRPVKLEPACDSPTPAAQLLSSPVPPATALPLPPPHRGATAHFAQRRAGAGAAALPPGSPVRLPRALIAKLAEMKVPCVLDPEDRNPLAGGPSSPSTSGPSTRGVAAGSPSTPCVVSGTTCEGGPRDEEDNLAEGGAAGENEDGGGKAVPPTCRSVPRSGATRDCQPEGLGGAGGSSSGMDGGAVTGGVTTAGQFLHVARAPRSFPAYRGPARSSGCSDRDQDGSRRADGRDRRRPDDPSAGGPRAPHGNARSDRDAGHGHAVGGPSRYDRGEGRSQRHTRPSECRQSPVRGAGGGRPGHSDSDDQQRRGGGSSSDNRQGGGGGDVSKGSHLPNRSDRSRHAQKSKRSPSQAILLVRMDTLCRLQATTFFANAYIDRFNIDEGQPKKRYVSNLATSPNWLEPDVMEMLLTDMTMREAIDDEYTMSPRLLRVELNREMMLDKKMSVDQVAQIICNEYDDFLNIMLSDELTEQQTLCFRIPQGLEAVLRGGRVAVWLHDWTAEVPRTTEVKWPAMLNEGTLRQLAARHTGVVNMRWLKIKLGGEVLAQDAMAVVILHEGQHLEVAVRGCGGVQRKCRYQSTTEDGPRPAPGQTWDFVELADEVQTVQELRHALAVDGAVIAAASRLRLWPAGGWVALPAHLPTTDFAILIINPNPAAALGYCERVGGLVYFGWLGRAIDTVFSPLTSYFAPGALAPALRELLRNELQPLAEAVHALQEMTAANIAPIWGGTSAVSLPSNASSGAKKAAEERDRAIKIRLCHTCGYTVDDSTFLGCQLTCLKAGSPAVRSAHIFPCAKASMMPHLLGCKDVNVTGNMCLLLQPVEWALDSLFFTFVRRRGKLVARWLHPGMRDLRMIDSCTDPAVRDFLAHVLQDRKWSSLEGAELQQPGTWQPLLRAFALHAAFAMAMARRQGWLKDAIYQQHCEASDSRSFQSADTPAASVALWAATAAAADPPPLTVVGWTPPAGQLPALLCLCEPPDKPKLVCEAGTCFWVSNRKIDAKKPALLQPCILHQQVDNLPSGSG